MLPLAVDTKNYPDLHFHNFESLKCQRPETLLWWLLKLEGATLHSIRKCHVCLAIFFPLTIPCHALFTRDTWQCTRERSVSSRFSLPSSRRTKSSEPSEEKPFLQVSERVPLLTIELSNRFNHSRKIHVSCSRISSRTPNLAHVPPQYQNRF